MSSRLFLESCLNVERGLELTEFCLKDPAVNAYHSNALLSLMICYNNNYYLVGTFMLIYGL